MSLKTIFDDKKLATMQNLKATKSLQELRKPLDNERTRIDPWVKALSAQTDCTYTPLIDIIFWKFQNSFETGDATIRTKYQIRTRDGFGPNTNSAQNFNYL